MAEITAFLEQRLKLKVNADKSAAARPWQRKFLGYRVTWHRKPKLNNRTDPPPTLGGENPPDVAGAQGQSVRQVIAELNPILRGWVAYFRLIEEKGLLEALDGWIRRKVRALLWRHWKHGYARAQNLQRAGLSHERAWRSAPNGRGPSGDRGRSH